MTEVTTDTTDRNDRPLAVGGLVCRIVVHEGVGVWGGGLPPPQEVIQLVQLIIIIQLIQLTQNNTINTVNTISSGSA